MKKNNQKNQRHVINLGETKNTQLSKSKIIPLPTANRWSSGGEKKVLGLPSETKNENINLEAKTYKEN